MKSSLRLIFTGAWLTISGLLIGIGAQTITGVSAIWDDDFTEWSIFTKEDTVNFGTLELINMLGSPRLDWNFRVQDAEGRIRNIDRNNFSSWEVQGPNDMVTVRQLWSDDLREWRVTNNRIALNWRSRYANHYEEWVITSRDHGYFTMYTLHPEDPRDWVVVDTMSERIPLEMKMAFVFVTIFLTSPY